ncbi:MAG TPA: Helicase associated domain protein, partial [Cyclobacteriaceae bacterium]
GLRKNKNTLSTEQLRALDQLGLSLEKNAYFKSKWEHRYEELKSFKKRFGHMVVPKDTGDYIQLGSWVSVQRQYKHKLSPEQIKKLNQLGFSWGRKK